MRKARRWDGCLHGDIGTRISRHCMSTGKAILTWMVEINRDGAKDKEWQGWEREEIGMKRVNSFISKITFEWSFLSAYECVLHEATKIKNNLLYFLILNEVIFHNQSHKSIYKPTNDTYPFPSFFCSLWKYLQIYFIEFTVFYWYRVVYNVSGL